MRYRQNTKGDILYGPPVMEASDQIGQVSHRILLKRIECNETIVSQLLHRIALSSYGWTLNTLQR